MLHSNRLVPGKQTEQPIPEQQLTIHTPFPLYDACRLHVEFRRVETWHGRMWSVSFPAKTIHIKRPSALQCIKIIDHYIPGPYPGSLYALREVRHHLNSRGGDYYMSSLAFIRDTTEGGIL